MKAERPLTSSSFLQGQADFTPEFQCSSCQHILPSTCCHLTYLWACIRMEAPWEVLLSAVSPVPRMMPTTQGALNQCVKKAMNEYKKRSLQSAVILGIRHTVRREMCTFFLPQIEAQKMLRWPSVPEAVNQPFVLTACPPNSDYVWEK